ncbi:MAG: hypothetical protein JSW26_23755 [Desulfobacterales bacterium]|nr:MAG: hypothetical protein JSW26_23755 [Desulfobacterales bacterium]
MTFTNLRKDSFKSATLWIAFFVWFLPILISCSDGKEPSEEAALPDDTESFTFFDIGRTTKFSGQIRQELEEKLGRDAIERRSILDLEINYRGFIKKYFPRLENLNRQLNFPPGERVEHNTVKLMYRYAQRQNVPFDYVELVFSEYTQTPIMFKINFKKDEANIIETLKKKYGNPKIIDWSENNGQSMHWEKDADFLIVSLVPDQFGKHEYQIAIYFADNLKQLIDTERAEKEEKEQQRAKTGEKAF